MIGAGLICLGTFYFIGLDGLVFLNVVSIIPVIAITLGIIIVIVSFFGCCGSVEQSYCMLTTYLVFLVILCLSQVLVSSYCLITKENLLEEVQTYVENVFDNRTQYPERLDRIQLLGHCCGINSYEDYERGEIVPGSCCGYKSGYKICSQNFAYKNGCQTGFTEYIKTYIDWVIYYGYALAVIDMLGVFLTFHLIQSLKEKRSS